MKANSPPSRSCAAFTLIELLAVMAIVFLLAGFLLPSMIQAKHKAQRISCVSRLKQNGLAFRIFSGDHTNYYPMALSTNFGGTMELTNSPAEFFRHFQVMSNELSASLLLTCPSDSRQMTTNWATLANSNISYFIGLEADETNPMMMLAGDRNLTNGRPVLNGILTVATNDNIGWTYQIHRNAGNLGLADGSVQQVTSGKLREVIRNSGATNGVLRLAMPE